MYTEILYEILKVHNIGSLKNNTSKKIQSNIKIKENTDKYEELIFKMETFLLNNYENQALYEQISTILLMEKQILNHNL